MTCQVQDISIGLTEMTVSSFESIKLKFGSNHTSHYTSCLLILYLLIMFEFICSGDTDSVVPVTATRFSLSHLNLKIKTPWYPWYSGNQVTYKIHTLFYAFLISGGVRSYTKKSQRDLVYSMIQVIFLGKI